MVAIVLVNYNGADDTIECIKSLKKLTYSDYRIVVVDNDSRDESINELETFNFDSSIILLKSNVNDGFSAGNNIGIRYALNVLQADYIWLLNNDTVVKPDSLTELLKGFDSQKNVGITTAKTYYYNNKNMIWYAGGSINKINARTVHWHYKEIAKVNICGNQEMCKSVTFVSGCCMLIEKDVFKRVGLLDESYFLYEEDTDYCLRVLSASYIMLYCPLAVIYHKVNSSTGKSSKFAQYYSIRNKYRLIHRNFPLASSIIAFIYVSLQFSFRCIKKELDWKVFSRAFKAYIKGESGKHIFEIG